MKNKDYIFNYLRESCGPSEGSKLYLVTDIKTGETEVVIEKKIIERMPIQELEKAEDLYERLNCGWGRKLYTLEEIAHPFNPK